MSPEPYLVLCTVMPRAKVGSLSQIDSELRFYILKENTESLFNWMGAALLEHPQLYFILLEHRPEAYEKVC